MAIYIRAAWRNSGLGEAGPFNAQLFIDGLPSLLLSSLGLAPGQSEQSGPWPIPNGLPTGPHVFKLFVDSTDRVTETIENDNTSLEKTLTVINP